MSDGVRYDVLGPLRGWRGDEELDLGPSKQRAVLAVLLLNANKPVSTSAIIDAVWRDEPPANGANVVQKHVAGLRRLLDPDRSPRTTAGPIALTEAGYVLSVASGRLDSDVVDELLARSRVERAAGNLAQAGATLADALDRWRSDALAGLTGPVFDAARDHFAEVRADVTEAWVDVQLALGENELAVRRLTMYIAQFPVREHLREQLMLALYRCGRQAEALAAYRDAHRYLNEEFGVEPGEALTNLHQRILRADPTLMPAKAVPARAAPAPPDPVASGPAWAAPQPTRTAGQKVIDWLCAISAALASIVTFGAVTWLGLGIIALRLRSKVIGWCAAVYAVVEFAWIVVVGANSDDSAADTIGILLMFILGCAGALHMAIVTAQFQDRFASSRPAPPLSDFQMYQQHIRREHARQILAAQPDLARQLAIGRPDLPRAFDDGGLIDINAVPEHIFVLLLGLHPLHAYHVAVDRQLRGPFATVDDLVQRGLFDAAFVNRLRDLLVATAVEPAAAQSSAAT
jgi:DNA-binding SARP family transcriptional activator